MTAGLRKGSLPWHPRKGLAQLLPLVAKGSDFGGLSRRHSLGILVVARGRAPSE